MTHTKQRSITFTLEKRMSVGVGILLLGIVILYTYYVALSIAYVVEREELVHRTNVISEEVTRLERTYLTHSNTITEKEALAFGLVRSTAPIFIERARTLTLHNGE